MAAFQQRRRQQPQHDPAQSTTSDDWAQLASPSDDDPILLFDPPPALDSSQWSVVAPPRGRPTRTTSFASTLSSSTAASGPQSSLGSPSSLQQASLLPAHDGSGVFAGPADAASLVQSDVLFPSVYASALGDPDATSDASSAFSHLPPFARRDSHTSSTFSSFAGSDISSRASGGWALTEEALSSLPTSGAQRSHGRVRGGGAGGEHAFGAGDAHDEQLADDEDGASAGLTSGSEEEGQEAREGAHCLPLSARQAAVARAAAAQKQDEDDWAHSHLAMSAGILPPSRRRRPLPNTSALSRSLVAAAAAAADVPVSPGVVTSALRSLSPVSSARSRFSNSSGYKRRHRRAGGVRDGESKKRSSASVVPLQSEYMEKLMREEEERARRMQDLLRLRREEEELRLAQDKVLFGSTVRAYMSIEPATLALIAATPTSSAYPTPTPSRAASPTYGAKNFAKQAARGLRTSSFDGAKVDEVSDAETEVEAEHAPSPATQAAAWASYSAVVPPAASLRAVTAPSPRPGVAAAHRSHSTSDLPSYFLRPLSPSSPGEASALGLVIPATTAAASAARPHAHLMRRSSSYGPQSASPASPDLALLSHEERILLTPSASSASAIAEGDASAWGGELDSFALALGYWKRLLRRLKEGAGLAHDAAEGAREDDGMEGMVGGEGGEVRVAAEVY
ncbi:hypothetical protein JCM10450v2_005869 [Rhodotorula kratochvilovae]